MNPNWINLGLVCMLFLVTSSIHVSSRSLRVNVTVAETIVVYCSYYFAVLILFISEFLAKVIHMI